MKLLATKKNVVIEFHQHSRVFKADSVVSFDFFYLHSSSPRLFKDFASRNGQTLCF